MLLKFKNKHILAIDKMIKEADLIKGIIDRIEVDPKEGAGLLLEIINLGKDYISIITIIDLDGNDVTLQELLWNDAGIDKNEHIKSILQKWYRTHYTITYNAGTKDKIPIRVVKPKLDVAPPPAVTKSDDEWTKEPKHVDERNIDKSQIINSWKAHDDIPPITKADIDAHAEPPPKPKGPPNRLLQDGVFQICPDCGSSMKMKWFFFEAGGCIQPECDNYWKNK